MHSKMNLKSALLMLVITMPTVLCSYNSEFKNYGNCPNLKTPLGSVRKRRHLAFPTGSTIGVITSVVKTFMTHVPSGWYFVIEAEVVYKLPDAEFIAASKRRMLHHRQKKEAWEQLRKAFDSRNINGRVCILRSICEAKMHLAPKGKSLVHDILRSLFTAPLHDEKFVEEIVDTYNEILESDFCEKPNDCPFSILGFILSLNKQRDTIV